MSQSTHYYNPDTGKRMGTLKLRDQLRIPPINMELVKQTLALPEDFCTTCTLREGTILTLMWLQTKCVIFVGLAGALLYWGRHLGDRFWLDKFTGDFDPHWKDENKEFINELWPLWYDVTLLLIIVHSTYFVTGFGVIYALNVKDASPFWYLPWLIMSGFLVASIFIISGILLVFNCYLYSYREITVTWDLVPMVCVFVYGYGWAYGFFVSCAHYKRRCIVKYWRESQRKLGNMNF